MSIYSYIGIKRFRFKKDDAADVLNICTSISAVCEEHYFDSEYFYCSIPFFSAQNAKKIFEDFNLEFDEVSHKGLIPLILRYKKRVGIVIGALIVCFLFSLSPCILWNIELVGNDLISKEEAYQTLKDSGLFVGCFLPNLNVDNVESAALVNNGRISWISVNISGSNAYVELREKVDADKPNRILPYANIIATEDAIISELEIISGQAAVKSEYFVREGDLLISGVISKEAIGTKLTYARGNVYGKCFKEIEIEIPYSYSELEETGNKKYDLKCFFFSSEFFIFGKRRPYENFNESTTVYAAVKGQKRLPFYIEKMVYSESSYVEKCRDQKEAETEAEKQLALLLEYEYADAEIISKSITLKSGEESVVLYCELWYERQIGKTVEFDVTE